MRFRYISRCFSFHASLHGLRPPMSVLACYGRPDLIAALVIGVMLGIAIVGLGRFGR